MPLDAIISRIEERLDKLDAKPSSTQALMELLSRLDGKIREAQAKGYNNNEIVDLIVGCGLEVNASILKKRLIESLNSREKITSVKRPRTRRKKISDEDLQAPSTT